MVIMKENSVLYNIKSIHTSIVRELMKIDGNNELIRGLSPTQMMIIGYILNHSNEDVYQRDLESILNLRRATVSGVLQTMEKNGLIKRITSKKDTRTKIIIMQEDAKKFFLMHQKDFEIIEEYMTKGLTDEEITCFLHIIKKMQGNLKDSIKER